MTAQVPSTPETSNRGQERKLVQCAHEALGTPTTDETEVLQTSIKAGSVAEIVVAFIAVIGLVCLLKLVLVTTLFSVLLAFVFACDYIDPLRGFGAWSGD